jgi:glucosamine--fructose-6-phosphate aminotransferase (isomerizing)
MEPTYLNDLLNQPPALQDTLAALAAAEPLSTYTRRLADGQLQRIVLTGMGSSYQALIPLGLRLIGHGLNVQWIEASELVHYARALINPHSLIVAVSQSGESVETLRLLDLAEKRAHLIGVTNTPGSSLAQRSEAAVLTQAGTEVTVSCKTYLAALAALTWLGDCLIGEPQAAQFPQLQEAPEAVRSYLDRWQAYTAGLEERLRGARHLFLVGRGASLAAVGTGGLILKEAAHFPAEGMSSAAFRHGPLEMVGPETFVLVYTGSPETADLNRQLVDDICRAGGESEVVETVDCISPFALPPAPPATLPLLEILPAQMLTLALANLTGHEPGKFSHATKVTIVE